MNVIGFIWNTLGTLDLEMLCVVGILVFSIPFVSSPLQFFEKEYQLISVYHYPKSSSHL